MRKVPSYNPQAVTEGINKVFGEEVNEAPRYNPFLLLEPDSEFDDMVLNNAKEESITQLLKS